MIRRAIAQPTVLGSILATGTGLALTLVPLMIAGALAAVGLLTAHLLGHPAGEAERLRWGAATLLTWAAVHLVLAFAWTAGAGDRETPWIAMTYLAAAAFLRVGIQALGQARAARAGRATA